MTIFSIYYIILINQNAVFILNYFLILRAGNVDGKKICSGK